MSNKHTHYLLLPHLVFDDVIRRTLEEWAAAEAAAAARAASEAAKAAAEAAAAEKALKKGIVPSLKKEKTTSDKKADKNKSANSESIESLDGMFAYVLFGYVSVQHSITTG